MSEQSEHEYARSYSVMGGFLSYLLPGLGQIAQGRIAKGLLFMVCLLGLFHVGEWMGNWQNVYVPKEPGKNIFNSVVNNRWHFAGQVWIGVAAWPAIWQFYREPRERDVNGHAGEQPAPSFWQEYQKQPPEGHDSSQVGTLNHFLVNSDKTPDLGWIYTVIAGMLNVLVIYDAFAGPAYGRAMPPAG